ncbi:methyltransferase domain-containing protein [Streptomyces pactum]|uniref:methyltransferase domain-containing protein n=1 Tax=Streptomyces pactum TaxID=68249 RepID=UPI0027DAE5A3|nr:methyltransferase domain-containing protein [Streptomyces pactum]
MNDTQIANARPRLAALVEELRDTGALRTPEWVTAFAAVPRHLFVPQWYSQETNEQGLAVWRRRDADDDRGAWLDAVYSDQTLVTALDPATAEQVDDDAWTGLPTSSNTMPSVIAGMLEDLSVRDGDQVWDVGTGTGYLTALLCTRLGSRHVYSTDVVPDLVETARRRLAQLGHEPHLAAGDARDGYPGDASFDRVIATCSVPAVPPAWVEQTRPGGLILTDIALGIEGGVVRLTIDADRSGSGRFTAGGGRFMAARGDAHTYPAANRPAQAPATHTRPTTVTAADIRAHYPFRLLLAFHLPTVELVYHLDDDTGAMAIQLQHPDGSWARAPLSGPQTVTVGGSPELWHRVEDAWNWWNLEGRPDHTQFGYRREADGSAHVWHIPTGRAWPL